MWRHNPPALPVFEHGVWAYDSDDSEAPLIVFAVEIVCHSIRVDRVVPTMCEFILSNYTNLGIWSYEVCIVHETMKYVSTKYEWD